MAIFSLCVLLGLSSVLVYPPPSFSNKENTSHVGLGPHSNDLIVTGWASVKTLSPNKVTFWDVGARTATYEFWKGTQFNSSYLLPSLQKAEMTIIYRWEIGGWERSSNLLRVAEPVREQMGFKPWSTKYCYSWVPGSLRRQRAGLLGGWILVWPL